MTAARLLEKIEAQGVTLWAEGDALRYRARPGALTPERQSWLRNHKLTILAALKVRQLGLEPFGELLEFWTDDAADILALPDDTLFVLADDYRRHRAYYQGRQPGRSSDE